MEGHRSFKLAPHNSKPPNPPNPPSSSQPSSRRHCGSYNPRMTAQEKLDDVIGYLHNRWSSRDFIRHLVLDNSHHNYASKPIEAIWSDNEVIQKLQNELSFKDATTGVEVYKRELTALESTTTFGRYTRTLDSMTFRWRKSMQSYED